MILKKFESEQDNNLIGVLISIEQNKHLFNSTFNTSTFNLTSNKISEIQEYPLLYCRIILNNQYKLLIKQSKMLKKKFIKNKITLLFEK